MARNGRATAGNRAGQAITGAGHRLSYGRGVVFVLAGGTCLSLGGVLIRHIETAGVGLMFADALVGGTWLGNVIALGAPLTLAVTVVAWRSNPGVDMVPATLLSGVIGLAIGALMADDLAISAHDLLLSLLLGSAQLGAGFLLFTLGSRSVPAGEVPLYGLAETVLAPIWVWLAINEVPGPLTLGGGVIVLSAVVMAAAAGLRSGGPNRPKAP